MKKAFNILLALGVVFLLWIAVSTMEVVAKNLDTDPTYSAVNFYQVWLG